MLRRKHSGVTFPLKVLSLCAFLCLIFYFWTYKSTLFPFYWFRNQGNIFAIVVYETPWLYLLSIICIFVSGLLDRARILYIFPFIAYFMLITNVCSLIAYHRFDHSMFLPPTLLTISNILIITLGLIILFIWVNLKKSDTEASLSLKVKTNLNRIALLTYIVFVLNLVFAYQKYSSLLIEYGSIAIALDYAGLRNLIVWGIILIACYRKWPYILWLFPVIAYDYLWPLLKILIIKSNSMSLQVLTFSSIGLVLLGLYTFFIWILEKRGQVGQA